MEAEASVITRTWAVAGMLGAASSYGLVATLVKEAVAHGVPLTDLTHWQFLASAVGLWLAVAAFGRRAARPSRRDGAILAGIGACTALTSYTYYRSLLALPASLAVVLLFQFTWMVLALDILVTRRWPSAAQWAGTALVLAGTGLAVGPMGPVRPLAAPGAWLLGLAAALSYALTLYGSGRVASASSPLWRSAVSAGAAALAIWPLFPPAYLQGDWPSGLWFWGSLAAIVGQLAPTLLMLVSIPHLGGRAAGVLGAVELPVSVAVAHWVLREPVTPWQWGGVALILAGIVASEGRKAP